MKEKKKIVALLPIKLNNQRVPGKNIKHFSDGTPLMHLIQKTSLESEMVNGIFVYCSSCGIQKYIIPSWIGGVA